MHQLPLWSHWGPKFITADFQVDALKSGKPILPIIPQPTTAQTAAEWRELLHLCGDMQMPLCVVCTQWEDCLRADACCVAYSNGQSLNEISPYSPREYWRWGARQHFKTAGMAGLQKLYPDPPKVYFLSNNEARKLRWVDARKCDEHVKLYPTPLPEEELRSHFGHQWIQRYSTLFDEAKKCLSDSWRDTAKFIGYNIGERQAGRWNGWRDYSLDTNERVSPYWIPWDGASFQCYTPPHEHTTDYTVQGCAAEIGNYLWQLDEAREHDPDFYCDMSFWDGNTEWNPSLPLTSELADTSKACQYFAAGQTYDEDRYAGWLQLLLWMLRPQSIREFRWYNDPREPWMPYVHRSMECVERIHNSPLLKKFWEEGELLASSIVHPYRNNLPTSIAARQHWYGMPMSVNPCTPWKLDDTLPVTAVALKRDKEYLLYAHAPLGLERNVWIDIPGFAGVAVDVPREGAFYHVKPVSVTKLT